MGHFLAMAKSAIRWPACPSVCALCRVWQINESNLQQLSTKLHACANSGNVATDGILNAGDKNAAANYSILVMWSVQEICVRYWNNLYLKKESMERGNVHGSRWADDVKDWSKYRRDHAVIYISSMPTMHATICHMQIVGVSDEAWFVYTRNDSPAADSS